MATEAGHAAAVHRALHKILTLHAVLVCRAIGEMRKRSLAELVLFELPAMK
jgi:hypothetical protein